MLPHTMLLHVVSNMTNKGNNLIRDGLRELQRRLPPGWSVGGLKPAAGPAVDAMAKVIAPDKSSSRLAIEARLRPDPRAVAAWLDTLRSADAREPVLLISRYLSASVRERLRREQVGFLDLTGNVHLVLSKPGLFIETEGASEDPDREARPARSLSGPKAGRLVRALVDLKLAPGVRELAGIANVDPGYVSRIMALLESEALIERRSSGSVSGSASGARVGSVSGSRSGPRSASSSGSRSGPITRIDWQALVRRWARDAPLDARGSVRTYLEPRGIPAFLSRLTKSKERYAVTGSLAAARFAPVAPARLATVWLNDAEQGATRLGIRPVDAGANVFLIEPADESVFDRAVVNEGIVYSAPSQIAADLLTSPGRGPAEAEDLIAWMSTHEEVWRGSA